jgi:hypothetical protein
MGNKYFSDTVNWIFTLMGAVLDFLYYLGKLFLCTHQCKYYDININLQDSELNITLSMSNLYLP